MGIKLSSKSTVTSAGTSKLLLVNETELNLIDPQNISSSQILQAPVQRGPADIDTGAFNLKANIILASRKIQVTAIWALVATETDEWEYEFSICSGTQVDNTFVVDSIIETSPYHIGDVGETPNKQAYIYFELSDPLILESSESICVSISSPNAATNYASKVFGGGIGVSGSTINDAYPLAAEILPGHAELTNIGSGSVIDVQYSGGFPPYFVGVFAIPLE